MRVRHVVMMSALLGVISLAGLSTLARGAEATAREEAVVSFQDPVLVGGRFLMGKVLIVHDEELKARGEPCTVIYQLDGAKRPALVVALHCKRVSRPVAEQFTVGTRMTDPPFRILTAYQFRGSDHAHQLVEPREAESLHGVH
jgi:hypothetical protein